MQASSEVHPISYSMDNGGGDQNQDTDSLHHEDGGDTFLWYDGNDLQNQMTLKPRSPQSKSLPWEHQTSKHTVSVAQL
jgi:hypothetical protein